MARYNQTSPEILRGFQTQMDILSYSTDQLQDRLMYREKHLREKLS